MYLIILTTTLITVAIIVYCDSLHSLAYINIQSADITVKDKPKKDSLSLIIPHTSNNAVSETERNIFERKAFMEHEKIPGEDSYKNNTSKSSFEFGSKEFALTENGSRTNVYDLIRRIHKKIRIVEPTVKPLVFFCNKTSVDGNGDLLCMVCKCFIRTNNTDVVFLTTVVAAFYLS